MCRYREGWRYFQLDFDDNDNWVGGTRIDKKIQVGSAPFLDCLLRLGPKVVTDAYYVECTLEHYELVKVWTKYFSETMMLEEYLDKALGEGGRHGEKNTT